jgi:CRISPR-associated endonuclease/helicase Cas3
MEPEYSVWFEKMLEFTPHNWQQALADDIKCKNRLIRIPTGMGKTIGVLAAWLYHRVILKDEAWPRRLVWCLPMRVLVEQTETEARTMLKTLGLLWDEKGSHQGKVGVHVLMGGVDGGDWHLHPEECSILIGTQDMLLSRALNRGYGTARARWPMEFGQLNQDAIWVMDEVQLMDVGLATSAQLQQFREEDQEKSIRPCFTWWMSATLQPDWLESVDTKTMVEKLKASQLGIPAKNRTGNLWNVTKSLEIEPVGDNATIAAIALREHKDLADSTNGKITLVILNTVDRAIAVYDEIRKRRGTATDDKLIHSRFRGQERAMWREAFLCRNACRQGVDRIIVATQVVEAGVDISAGCLVTELAPWPSLVQRFGRAARYGGKAKVVVVSRNLTGDKDALPYERLDLEAALNACNLIKDKGVSQASLEDFEAALDTETRSKLYPYAPMHLLLRRELDELFDTTPDLTGTDLDISRFIRTGEERDCQVFWDTWDGEVPPDTLQAPRQALCSIACYKVAKWLCEKGKLKDGCQAFVFDYLSDQWKPLREADIRPGRTILVHPDWGGYHPEKGFTGEKRGKNEAAVQSVPLQSPISKDMLSDIGQDNDRLSLTEIYQTISQHGLAVAGMAANIAKILNLATPIQQRLAQAGRFHDLGKAHPRFQALISPTNIPGPFAKAPKSAWNGLPQGGLRHELASALALFELLAITNQHHEALLGSCAELIEIGAISLDPVTAIPSTIGNELALLNAAEFNLLLYLVASHHGKVRAALHACPADQAAGGETMDSMPIRGIYEHDKLPAFPLPTHAGKEEIIVGLSLHLAPAQLGLSGRYGPSWRERTLSLQEHYGPFALAYLEALLRAADIRTSREVAS